MKYSELLRMLQKAGWYVTRQTGSHIVMKHPDRPEQLTVPFHASKEVKKGMLAALLKRAGIKTTKR